MGFFNTQLKVKLDEGSDYIDLFRPILLDCIRENPKDDFSSEDLQVGLRERGFAIPQKTILTLLKRIRKAGNLAFEGGRYLKISGFTYPPLQEHTAEIEEEHKKVAAAFRAFAADQGIDFAANSDAIGELIAFLDESHLDLLDEADTFGEDASPSARVAARFFKDVFSDPVKQPIASHLNRLLQGFVLQNTLILGDINSTTRRFSRLTAYFDTSCVFAVLGLHGDPTKEAMQEGVSILKATGVRVGIFEATIRELRSVLRAIETRIATTQGRETIRPSSVGRYFLQGRFTAADIRQFSSLVEEKVADLGFAIDSFPTRVPKYVLDERSLSIKLKKTEDEPETHPRIVHDVECVGAILTQRKGRKFSSYDDARAVFVTTNGRLISTVREWLGEQGVEGLSPIIHQMKLTNLAWLKKPQVGALMKTKELIALCMAALRPTKETWQKFVDELAKLRAQGEITSDESVAVLASSLVDEELAAYEEKIENEAGSIREAIDRVKAKITSDVHKAEQEKADVVDQVDARSRQIAKAIARGVLVLTSFSIILGLVLSLPGLLDLWPWPWLGWVALAAFGLATLASLFTSYSPRGICESIEARLARRIRGWFVEDRTRGRS